MNLKQIARQHTSGGVTWWLMPYATLRNQAVATEFAHIVPRDRWDTVQHTFVMLEGTTVDVDFAIKVDSASESESTHFREYWSARPLDLAARWESFTLLVSDRLVDAFWEAYFATREPLIEVDDPERAAVSAPTS